MGERLDRAGASAPLGASLRPDGVNFSVFSRDASLVELLLFDDPECGPERVIPLDPHLNRTYHYWHGLVEGLEPDRCTPIARTDRSRHSAGYASIRGRRCSIHTDARLWSRKVTTVPPPNDPETTRPRR